MNTESDLDGVSSRHVALSKHWMDLVGSQWLLPWLFLSGTAVFLVAACWLAGRAAHSPGAHRLLIAASSSLHLVAFTVFLLHARREASRLRLSRRASIALIAISALWLLPLPYFFLAFLLYFPMSLKPSNTLISEALIREKVAGRSPLWLRFEDRLRVLWPEISPLWRWWSPPRPVDREVERSQEEDRILRLYNLESYSLGFDAAALAWALVWISEHQPVWSQGLGWIHCTVLTISFLLFAVGFCAAAVHIVLLFLRSPGRLRMLDRYPYANYLAKTQFCCFLGWISGLTLRTYGARQIAGILISFSMLLVLLKCYYHLLMLLVPQVRSRQRPLDALIGIALLVLLPTLVAISPAWGSLTATLALWAVLYPVRAFLLGRFLVPWLLRPFAWEDLFASGIPIRLRVLLASLAAPAVLPLGGLAAPLQIFARHKLWPRAEAFWREREKHELP
ncbi:MAG TPA: hypothetical protein VE685_21190 [Thermoanaerobaculia bacterium]|nr:hypothetical protein [Thermoanaerobaculia bacterium]